jgi:membrane protein implicated in regulation of membrane protease activity
VPGETSEGWLASLYDYLKLLTLELQVLFRTEGALSVLLRVLGGLGRLAVFLVPALAVVVVLIIRRRRRRRKEPAGADPRVAVLHALLAVMDESVAKSGIERREDETLHQFAARLRGEEAEIPESCAQWYRDYAGVRYSGDVTSEDLDRLRETLPG